MNNQSAIQIQKKKQLTFEEICPLWSANLNGKRQDHFTHPDGRTLSIHHPQWCVAGEAHGWRDDYYFNIDNLCQECIDVGDHLQIALYHNKNTDELIERFVNHWNDKHL